MKTRSLFFAVAAVIAGLAIALFARRPTATLAGEARVFEMTGVVRAPYSEGQVAIEHEAVAHFMPAMTMPFYVAESSAMEAARLAVGDRVRFRFVVGASSHAEGFKVIGHESPAPSVDAALSTKRLPRLREGGLVPEFSLVDQDKQPTTRADLEGHFTLLTFIFTRCPVPEFCPAMSRRFAFLQDEILSDENLRAKTRLLSVTLDPEFDRPEILHDYGTAMGAKFTTWRFVTGAPEDAKALARAFSVFSERKAGVLDHTLCTALIGPDARVIAIWRGNGWKTDEVLAALRAASANDPSGS